MEKKGKIIYDLESLPTQKGVDMEMFLKIRDNFNVILWDSSHGGREPKVIDGDLELEILDVATAPERLKKLLDE